MALMYDDYKSGNNKMEQIKNITDEIKDLDERLTRIEYIVTGVDGKNGLRSNQQKMLSELDSVKRIVWIAVGIAIVIQLLIPVLLKK